MRLWRRLPISDSSRPRRGTGKKGITLGRQDSHCPEPRTRYSMQQAVILAFYQLILTVS